MYWFPWLKRELKGMGFEVELPSMPSPLSPKIEEWVPHLVKVVGKPDQNTFFIGHSIGCQAILRYLETLSTGERVGGALFLAPFLELPDIEKKILKPWLDTPIQFEKIKEHLPGSIAVFSDDDPLVPIENKNLFEEKLGSKIEVVHKFNHFVTYLELPIILKELAPYL
jgi:predicted alpha/beta hydrolase family esterase